jgi:hypothetical protein
VQRCDRLQPRAQREADEQYARWAEPDAEQRHATEQQPPQHDQREQQNFVTG